MNCKSCFVFLTILTSIVFILSAGCNHAENPCHYLKINEKEYFETSGLNILAFSNWYDVNFFDDSKLSGIEIIHHEVRTATNGDVRLNPTPEQWDPLPKLLKRIVNKEKNGECIEAHLAYPAEDFNYVIKAQAHDNGVLLSVELDKPMSDALAGRAGFNLEFLPAAYFEKAFLIDGKSGLFPLYPTGPMEITAAGVVEPQPFAKGKTLVLAPEDPARRISIEAKTGELMLFDGRNKAQNGWFVVRTPLPQGKTGKVVEWFLTANTIDGWVKPAVIAHSQVGYLSKQKKVAIIELDKNDKPLKTASILKVTEDGRFIEAYKNEVKNWGSYLRYNYCTFDFTPVSDAGLYIIEYGNVRTKPFRIAQDVFENCWQATLDVFFPVQMDHMFVNEAYKVWHGTPHLDDALQAPVNHKHFDLYMQGPTTDTPYQPGEHIPGLNIGGWFDAGDFDIRTPSHYYTVMSLVETWETFGLKRDETLIDQQNRYVDIHHPDGSPDLLQQIEHGTLALLAQHRAVGHAINGIIEPDLGQYTHLGDASTKTDNLIYNPKLKPNERDCNTSGRFDDRWAFTSKSTALNYGSIAALAAASRALKGYNDALAEECITTAKRVWEEEHSQEPNLFSFGNTTGGPMDAEELNAAIELLISTRDNKYAKRIEALCPNTIEKQFGRYAIAAVRVIPYMHEAYAGKIKELTKAYKEDLKRFEKDNPFGVPIFAGGWAGSGFAIRIAITNYILHKQFPEIIDAEYVLRGLNYIYGCHPASDISLVSAVGTYSKKIAYGNNRADFSFIAGGIVPGILIIKPDFPENKEDWPFLWAENEYTIGIAASYIYLVNAANDLAEAHL